MSGDPSESLGDLADPTTEPIRTHYDWDSTAPSTAVVKTVAIAADEQPTALAPLYSQVDPDALDALCRQDSTVLDGGDLQVSFPYVGHEVTVTNHGTVIVESPQGMA